MKKVIEFTVSLTTRSVSVIHYLDGKQIGPTYCYADWNHSLASEDTMIRMMPEATIIVH